MSDDSANEWLRRAYDEVSAAYTAELAAAEAEVARLKADLSAAIRERDAWDKDRAAERFRLRAEVERLREELARHSAPKGALYGDPEAVAQALAWRAALADCISGFRYIEQWHGRLYGVGWDRVYSYAALAGGPSP